MLPAAGYGVCIGGFKGVINPLGGSGVALAQRILDVFMYQNTVQNDHKRVETKGALGTVGYRGTLYTMIPMNWPGRPLIIHST